LQGNTKDICSAIFKEIAARYSSGGISKASDAAQKHINARPESASCQQA